MTSVDSSSDSEVSSSSSLPEDGLSQMTPRKTIAHSHDPHRDDDKDAGQAGAYADKTEMYASKMSRSRAMPAGLVPYFEKASKIVVTLIAIIETAIPYIHRIYDKLNFYWVQLAPYNPELLLPSFMGLIMCFFGGSFLTLIAAVEAYRMIGYTTTVEALTELVNDVRLVSAANKKDDDEDLDNDGIKDVNEISSEKLVARKTLLMLRTIDPQRLSDALQGLNAGFLAVVATLKLQFAKAITLGHAIAHTIEVPTEKFILPHIEAAIPVAYRKWAAPTMKYIINAISISIAWSIQRVISAFHSAIRGGFMCTRNILKYLSVKGYVHINHEDTYIDEIGGIILAAVGLLWQLSHGFSLPFPLNILLFPFSLAEYFLVWTINNS